MRPSLQAKNLIIARSSQTSRFSSRQPSQGLGGGNTGTIAVIKTGPKAVTPESLYPDLPIGGSYGDLLAYFVGKNVPTFRFVDMPASMACVALGFAYIAVFFPIPIAYHSTWIIRLGLKPGITFTGIWRIRNMQSRQASVPYQGRADLSR
jgi:hypothetical protein